MSGIGEIAFHLTNEIVGHGVVAVELDLGEDVEDLGFGLAGESVGKCQELGFISSLIVRGNNAGEPGSDYGFCGNLECLLVLVKSLGGIVVGGIDVATGLLIVWVWKGFHPWDGGRDIGGHFDGGNRFDQRVSVASILAGFEEVLGERKIVLSDVPKGLFEEIVFIHEVGEVLAAPSERVA